MATVRHNAIARRHPARPRSKARPTEIIAGLAIRNGDSKSVSAACDAYFRRHGMQQDRPWRAE